MYSSPIPYASTSNNWFCEKCCERLAFRDRSASVLGFKIWAFLHDYFYFAKEVFLFALKFIASVLFAVFSLLNALFPNLMRYNPDDSEDARLREWESRKEAQREYEDEVQRDAERRLTEAREKDNEAEIHHRDYAINRHRLNSMTSPILTGSSTIEDDQRVAQINATIGSIYAGLKDAKDLVVMSDDLAKSRELNQRRDELAKQKREDQQREHQRDAAWIRYKMHRAHRDQLLDEADRFKSLGVRADALLKQADDEERLATIALGHYNAATR